MKFVDTAQISISAGKGGDGHLSFRRTRGNPKGGPDGGDGGRGGNVILRADHNSSTLSKYRTNRRWAAEPGQEGGKNKRHGRDGQDVVLSVPPGTLASVDEKPLADLSRSGDEAVIARGGRGGFGNAHFTSSVRQAPKFAELGEQGESFDITLELKLVADVGLVGLPNAGKSTLLSVISAARPKIADYPFTTLVPNLGVVDVDESSFLVADIPGLVEGAAAGRGLGDEFLRHVERTKLLIHLIDITSQDVAADYQTIRAELADYKIDLSGYPTIVALNKIDAVDEKSLKAKTAQLRKVVPRRTKIITISAVAQQNLTALLRAAASALSRQKPTEAETAEAPIVITLNEDKKAWRIEPSEAGFVIHGQHLESLAARTNFDQPPAVWRLRDVLKKEGVLKELRRLGAGQGDVVRLGEKEIRL